MYFRNPDVFNLLLSTLGSELTVAPFVSEWGKTDENLCCFNGVLIGQLMPDKLNGKFVVKLVPNLDKTRNYQWPEPVQFKQALMAFISTASGWELECEKDCDQRTIEKLESDLALISVRLDEVLIFCCDGGKSCPTFRAAYLRSP